MNEETGIISNRNFPERVVTRGTLKSCNSGMMKELQFWLKNMKFPRDSPKGNYVGSPE